MHLYNCQLHQINSQPKQFDCSCLVCEMMTSSHKFEDCPNLANSNLLHQQFITFCQVYKRGKRALSVPPTGKEKVNLFQVQPVPTSDSNPNDILMKEEDFV